MESWRSTSILQEAWTSLRKRSQEETPDVLSAERLIEETDHLQSGETEPLDLAEIRLPRDEVQMLRPREMLDLPFGDLLRVGAAFAGGNGLSKSSRPLSPPFPFRFRQGVQICRLENLEKHESVVFWEKNIGQIEENLLALTGVCRRNPPAGPGFLCQRDRGRPGDRSKKRFIWSGISCTTSAWEKYRRRPGQARRK